jgi:hypothetical protein
MPALTGWHFFIIYDMNYSAAGRSCIGVTGAMGRSLCIVNDFRVVSLNVP